MHDIFDYTVRTSQFIFLPFLYARLLVNQFLFSPLLLLSHFL